MELLWSGIAGEGGGLAFGGPGLGRCLPSIPWGFSPSSLEKIRVGHPYGGLEVSMNGSGLAHCTTHTVCEVAAR